MTSLKRYLAAKLAACDPVIARVETYAHQNGEAELGAVYRTRYLFADEYVALEHRRIAFVGGGSAFGEVPNHAGEIGFLFLRHLNNRIYQSSWHGHIPVQRHDGELWCLLYSFSLWNDDAIPATIEGNWKPGTVRVDHEGQPFDTWVRFDAMNRYLRELISELDQCACAPVILADVNGWLQAL